MVTSRKAFALCIVTLAVCSFAANNVAVDARMISYGGIIKGDEAHLCWRGRCRPRLPPPSNHYNHGCEVSNMCRGGPP
ncbi:hypothetical protein NL676_013247 [Syzygium grande]|nr:hypothetical protein NL676_013247 [Syzygium grande]